MQSQKAISMEGKRAFRNSLCKENQRWFMNSQSLTLIRNLKYITMLVKSQVFRNEDGAQLDFLSFACHLGAFIFTAGCFCGEDRTSFPFTLFSWHVELCTGLQFTCGRWLIDLAVMLPTWQLGTWRPASTTRWGAGQRPHSPRMPSVSLRCFSVLLKS